MNKYLLRDMAKIDISSVDKKIKENEINIKLCNFIDVYNNWAITKEMYNKFMIATANKNEIERYKLKKGMIAITKDSETREDIGMATYIADSFEDVILGYHTALIIPDNTKIESKYLNAYLNSNLARKYFSNSASGSGQRYTLTIDSIGSLPLYLPPIDIQKKIGNLLSYIDRKIESNSHINNNLEELIKIIYQRWFVEFEFPNEEGKPYKSSGGKLVYNEELKQDIPENWCCKKIIEISNLYQPETITIKDINTVGDYFIYGAGGLMGNYSKFNHEEAQICISCRGNCGDVFLTQPKSWITGNVMVVNPIEQFNYKEFIFRSLFKRRIEPLITGSVQKQITRTNLSNLKLLIPHKKIVEKFEEETMPYRNQINTLIKENIKLIELKNFLLPMFINGQINVDDIEI